ncbi:MAG: hypothetical protein ABIJ31_05880 [Pseudomonadota bacterium]
MKKVSQIWFEVQELLFHFIEKTIKEPIAEKRKQLAAKHEIYNKLVGFTEQELSDIANFIEVYPAQKKF